MSQKHLLIVSILWLHVRDTDVDSGWHQEIWNGRLWQKSETTYRVQEIRAQGWLMRRQRLERERERDRDWDWTRNDWAMKQKAGAIKIIFVWCDPLLLVAPANQLGQVVVRHYFTKGLNDWKPLHSQPSIFAILCWPLISLKKKDM